MTYFLLDVNVLIALVRPKHEKHEKVMRWFRTTGGKHWATCPFTEAGFVRIVSNPKFTAQSVDVTEALQLLSELTAIPGRRFWPIDTTFAEAVKPFEERFFGHQQVTDLYLLSLAVRHKGAVATTDRGMASLAGTQYANNIVVL